MTGLSCGICGLFASFAVTVFPVALAVRATSAVFALAFAVTAVFGTTCR